MAIADCQEIGSGRVGPTMERQGVRTVMTAERSWKVITDDRETEGVEILIMANRANFLNGVPIVGDAYQTDNVLIPWMRCVSVTPEQDGDDPYFWNVRASYTSDFQSELAGSAGTTGGNTGAGGNVGTGGGMQPNPLLRPQQVSYSTRVRKKMLDRDANDLPVVNSAGERFSGGIEEDEYNLVITIKRNKQVFNHNLAWINVGCVNESPWEGFDARSARITNWTGDPAEESNVFYYVETIEVEAQWPNWDIEVLNEGTYGISRNATTGHYEGGQDKVDEESGIPINGKVLLDAKGGILPRTSIAAAITANAAAQAVTPAMMKNIFVGESLIIGSGADEETVVITATTATTFSAIFTQNHLAGVRVTGVPTYQTFERRAVNFTAIPISI